MHLSRNLLYGKRKYLFGSDMNYFYCRATVRQGMNITRLLLARDPLIFCDAVFPKLFNGELTGIGFGPTENLVPRLSGKPVSELFGASVSRFPVVTY